MIDLQIAMWNYILLKAKTSEGAKSQFWVLTNFRSDLVNNFDLIILS